MSDKLSKVYTIAVAALLHDIGKLLQRAGVKPPPDMGDIYNRAHATITAEFFTGTLEDFNYKKVFEKFPPLDKDASLGALASKHHKPDTPMQWIITAADRLASGFERMQEQDKHYDDYLKLIQQQKGNANFKNILLRNIFMDASPQENVAESFYPLEKLNPDLKPIPEPALKNTAAADGYNKLMKGMLGELSELAKNVEQYSLENIYQAICSIMERHCWCVPAATVSYENGKFIPKPNTISLYDHGRTAAALACALYSYHSAKNIMDIQSISKNDDEAFCMIQGDFSGIQDFIFDKGGESNKFAAKILRAKSFYVSMATEAAAYALCDRLDIPYAAIVLNAGGKFTIITGNTGEEQVIVDELRKEINKQFHKLTFGQTKFNIACMTCKPSELMVDKFSELMTRLSNKLGVEKLKHDIEEHVFSDYLQNRTEKGICQICGQHWADTSTENINLCRHCDEFQKIGTALVKAQYVQFNATSGFHLFADRYFTFDADPAQLTFNISSNADFKDYAKKRVSNYIPKQGTLPLTFEEIAEKGAKGAAHLAVLKADIDKLGTIFGGGLKYNSISKTATLSRMLDYFFTGWLQNMLEDKHVYTVFSGGDDLFLIGAWSEIVELSGEITHHLETYSGHNPEIHLSAGVILRRSTIPVRDMADAAERAMQKAKDGNGANDNRNRINIFGITTKWDEYFELTAHLDKLRMLYNTTAHGFMHRLLSFAESAELLEIKAKNGIITNDELMEAAKWPARFRYLVSRNYKENKENVEQIGALIAKYKARARIPLSIIIYETRGN